MPHRQHPRGRIKILCSRWEAMGPGSVRLRRSFGGCLTSPARNTPGRRGAPALIPGHSSYHTGVFFSKIGITISTKLLKDTHKSWVAYGPLLSSKEKLSKRKLTTKTSPRTRFWVLGATEPFSRQHRCNFLSSPPGSAFRLFIGNSPGSVF